MNPIILFNNIGNYYGVILTATDTAAGYNVNNIADGRTFTKWVAASAGTKYITLSGSYSGINSLGIINHNLFSSNAIVSIEYYDSSVSIWIQAQAGFTPNSNKAFLITFTAPNNNYITQWRIKIITASIAPYIGILYLGNYILFENAPMASAIPKSITLAGDLADSKTGNLLGSVIRSRPVQISLTFANFSRNFVDNVYYQFFYNYGSLLLPFFFAYDLTNYPNEIYFCTLNETSKYDASISVLSYYDQFTLNMRSVLE